MKRLLFVSVLCVASGALAYSALPQSTFTRLLPNGNLMFVMFSPSPEMDKQASGLANIAPKWRLRRQSGLYRINSKSNPLWTLTSYATSFDLCSDGVHLVLHYPVFAAPNNAIVFLKNGKIIRTYTLGELVDISNFKQPSLGPLSWAAQMRLDHERKLYFVKTSNGDSYTFDLATGQIITDRVPR